MIGHKASNKVSPPSTSLHVIIKLEVDNNNNNNNKIIIIIVILLHEKFLQFDWLRAMVFQLNLKYLHVEITNLLWVVV